MTIYLEDLVRGSEGRDRAPGRERRRHRRVLRPVRRPQPAAHRRRVRAGGGVRRPDRARAARAVDRGRARVRGRRLGDRRLPRGVAPVRRARAARRRDPFRVGDHEVRRSRPGPIVGSSRSRWRPATSATRSCWRGRTWCWSAPGTRRDTNRPGGRARAGALAHEFAANEIRPVAASYDETEAFPTEVVRKAARIGLTSFDLPAAYGGGGIDSVRTGCLIGRSSPGAIRRSGRSSAAPRSSRAAGGARHGGAAGAVGAAAVFGGPPMTALAITEPGAGSDAPRSPRRRHGSRTATG